MSILFLAFLHRSTLVVNFARLPHSSCCCAAGKLSSRTLGQEQKLSLPLGPPSSQRKSRLGIRSTVAVELLNLPHSSCGCAATSFSPQPLEQDQCCQHRLSKVHNLRPLAFLLHSASSSDALISPHLSCRCAARQPISGLSSKNNCCRITSSGCATQDLWPFPKARIQSALSARIRPRSPRHCATEPPSSRPLEQAKALPTSSQRGARLGISGTFQILHPRLSTVGTQSIDSTKLSNAI